MAQGGRWGAVVKQGGRQFPPAAPPMVSVISIEMADQRLLGRWKACHEERRSVRAFSGRALLSERSARLAAAAAAAAASKAARAPAA